MLRSLISPGDIDRLGWMLVHSVWQFTLLALAAAVLLWILKKQTAAIRYGGLLLLLSLTIAAPIATWCWLVSESPAPIVEEAQPAQEVPEPPPTVVPQMEHAVTPLAQEPVLVNDDPPPIPAEPDNVVEVPHVHEELAIVGWPAVVASYLRPWFPVLVLMWCAGVALFALRPAVSWLTIRRLRRVGTSAVPESVQSLFNNSVQRLKLRQSVNVLQSTLVQVPMVVGYLRPVVLLPVSLVTGLPANQLEAILTHELAHIRRHDYLINLAQILVETLFFYHPAIWWLSRRIRAERENCCDDLVVAALGNRVDYGRALLAVAELPGAGSALAMAANDGSLSSRVRRIVGLRAEGCAANPWSSSCLLACCLIAVWSLSAVLGDSAKGEDSQTTMIVEWTVLVEEPVLEKIRELDKGAKGAVPDTGTETIRCAGDKLRAVIKGHLDDGQQTVIGNRVEFLPPSPRGFFRSGIPRSFADVKSIPVGDDSLTFTLSGDGKVYIDEHEQGAELSLKMQFQVGQIRTETEASVKCDEEIDEGRAIGFVITPEHDEFWQPSYVVVYEAIRVPTRQMKLFKRQQRPVDWVRLGPARIKKRVARAFNWRESAKRDVADVDRAWTKDVQNGGHVQLIALSRPNKAPFLWWTPDGEPIAVDDPSGFTPFLREDDALVLVRLWETGAKRNAAPPGTTRISDGLLDMPDKCPDAPGSQLVILPVDIEETDHGPQLNIGTGFGPWTNETNLETAFKSSAVLNDVEVLSAGMSGFKRSQKTISSFRWEPTPDWEFTAAAITVDGEEVPTQTNPTIYSGEPPNTIRGAMSFEHPLLEEEIDSFVIKSRPCQWIKFTGFATEPAAALDPPLDFNADDEVDEQEQSALDNDSKFGPEMHGMRCRLVAVSPDTDDEAPDVSKVLNKFARGEDVTFAVELKNVSDEPVMLFGTRYGDSYGNSAGKLNTARFAPQLFEFQFTDAAGKPIPRTRRAFVSSKLLTSGCSKHHVAPGESLTVLLRPAKLMQPMGYHLPQGQYRATVTYRRPEGSLADVVKRIKKRRPDAPLAKSWPREVTSNAVEFSVQDDPEAPELIWGPAQNGLQAAIEFEKPNYVLEDPKQAPGVPLKTKIGVTFHVKNVGDEPVTFVSETSRQDDRIHLKNAAGEDVTVRAPFYSGWPIDIRWTLKPGEIAKLRVLDPALQTIEQPGQHKVSYTIRLNGRQMKDGQGNVVFPLPGDWQGELETGETPLILRPRTPEDDARAKPPTFVGRIAFVDEQSNPISSGVYAYRGEIRRDDQTFRPFQAGLIELPDCTKKPATIKVRAPGFEEAYFADVKLRPNQTKSFTLKRAVPSQFRLISAVDGRPVADAKVRFFNRTTAKAVSGPYPTDGIKGPIWTTSQPDGRVVLDSLQASSQNYPEQGSAVYFFYVEPAQADLAPRFLGPVKAGQDLGEVKIGRFLEVRGEVHGTPQQLKQFAAEWDQPFEQKTDNPQAKFLYAVSKRLKTKREGDKLTFHLMGLRPGKLRIISNFSPRPHTVAHTYGRRDPKGSDQLVEIDLSKPLTKVALTPDGYDYYAPANKNDDAPDAAEQTQNGQATISGRFVDEYGLPADVTGKLFYDSGRGRNRTTGFAGDYTGDFEVNVPAGSVWLKCEAPGYAPAWVGPLRVDAGEQVDDMQFVLKRGFAVTVKVMDQVGKPIPGASFYALPEINGQCEGSIDPHETGREGTYQLDHLADTRYEFSVNAAGYQRLRSQPLEIDPGGVVSLKLLRSHPCTGVVRNADGTPAAEAKLRVKAELDRNGRSFGHGNTGQGFWGKVVATTDQRGRFRLDQLTDDTHYLFVVETADGARAVVHNLQAWKKDLEIVVPKRRDLQIKITGDVSKLPQRRGKPFVSVRQPVKFEPKPGTSLGELFGDEVPVELTPTGGTAVMRGLAVDLKPGVDEQELKVTLGYEQYTRKTVLMNRTGDTEIEFRLPAKQPKFRSATESRSSPARSDHSAIWFHTGDHVHFVVYHDGFLQTGVNYTDYGNTINTSSLWKFRGHLNALKGRYKVDRAEKPAGRQQYDWKQKRRFELAFDYAPPNLTLSLDGKQYDLASGRVFVLRQKGELIQLPIDAPPVSQRAEIDRLAKQIQDKLPAHADQQKQGVPPKENGGKLIRKSADVAPMERRVSLKADKMPLIDALEAVSKQAGVPVELDEDALDAVGLVNEPVTVNIDNQPLQFALIQLFRLNYVAGIYPEVRDGKLTFNTLAAFQQRTLKHLPDWLKPHYNHGLLASIDDDGEVISITSSGVMNDELLAKLRTLPRLRELNMEGTKNITPLGLSQLAKLESLEKLILYNVNTEGAGMGDSALRFIHALKSLRYLRISMCGTTDAGIKRLERMPQLTYLSLQEGRLTDRALESIAKLKNLKHLSLSSRGGDVHYEEMRFSATAIRRLAGLQQLEELHLNGQEVPPDALVFPGLKSLSLGGAFVDNACAAQIAKCRNLESLNLSFTKINDDGLTLIAGIPTLKRLSLDSHYVTDAGIEQLKKLPALEYLHLRDRKLTDESLRHIAEIKTLTRLELYGNGGANLQPFPVGLELAAKRGLTIGGIPLLKKLPELRDLSLTNFGAAGSMTGLKELTQLRRLSMLMCPSVGLDELEEALPQLEITHLTGAGGWVSKRQRMMLARLNSQPRQPPERTEAKAAKEHPDVSKIVWGKPVKGLRLGIRPSPAAKHGTHFRYGDWMRYEVWIKNGTGETIHIPRDPRHGYSPRLKGKDINVVGAGMFASFDLPQEVLANATVTLKPGEFGRLRMSPQAVVRPLGSKRGRFGPEPLRVAPGKYSLAAKPELYVLSGGINDPKRGDGETIKLSSPATEITILPAARLQMRRARDRTEVDTAKALSGDVNLQVLDGYVSYSIHRELVIDNHHEVLLDQDDIASATVITRGDAEKNYSVALKLKPRSAARLQRTIKGLPREKTYPLLGITLDGNVIAARLIGQLDADEPIAIDCSSIKAKAEQLALTINQLVGQPNRASNGVQAALPSIDLSGDQVTAAAILNLAGQDWERVSLRGAKFDGAIIEALRHAGSIRRLRLSGAGLSGQVARLDKVNGLQELELGAPLKMLDLEALGEELSQLTHLKLPQDLQLTVTGARQIARLTRLRSLDLYGVELDDASFAELAPLVNLEELDLTHTRVSDQGLQLLAQMPKLRSLRLHRHPAWYISQQLSDACLPVICQLKNLETLSLSGEITDEGLAQIAALGKLKRLTLLNTKVSGSGLAALQHTSVEYLTLSPQLLRVSSDEGLMHLKECKQLKSINVIGQFEDEQVLSNWQKALPDVSWGFSS